MHLYYGENVRILNDVCGWRSWILRSRVLSDKERWRYTNNLGNAPKTSHRISLHYIAFHTFPHSSLDIAILSYQSSVQFVFIFLSSHIPTSVGIWDLIDFHFTSLDLIAWYFKHRVSIFFKSSFTDVLSGCTYFNMCTICLHTVKLKHSRRIVIY